VKIQRRTNRGTIARSCRWEREGVTADATGLMKLGANRHDVRFVGFAKQGGLAAWMFLRLGLGSWSSSSVGKAFLRVYSIGIRLAGSLSR